MRAVAGGTVRSDLETAIGVVLTSRSARDMILEAPDSFAAHFDLAPAEAAALAQMAGDLVSLTPGFLQKRERGLRRTFAVTLSLLGDEVDPLVEDYSDAFAPVDSTAAETLRFADFLVEETRELAGELPYGEIVADVARYERLRIRAFTAEGPLWPEPERAPLDPRHLDQGRPLWLHRSAAVEAFGWDVRTVRSPQILPRLRPDPANLLCFQRGEEGEGVVLRIDDESARAVELIALRPGEVNAAEIGEIIGSHRPPEALLGKLIAQGVIRGAES
jgi:hypothetical protein